jgi:outer membrane protein OmpA-like peptidoglycan-associated protein
VNLYGIYFDFDKAEKKSESKPTLDEVGKLLNGDANLRLQVIGHTDNKGTAEYNNNLSMRRAQSVVKELTTTYSVAVNRLEPSGAGFTKPVASNDTEEGRAKNRRVELVKM